MALNIGVLKVRQGDIGLAPIPAPAKAKRGEPVKRGHIVIALGETTGHAHVIEGAVAEFLIDGRRVLWVEAPTDAKHVDASGNPTTDHGWLPVQAGWYVVDDHQVQYTPAAIMRLAD